MAKKPTVTSITSGYASNTQLNANFEALRDAFDNTLSRDGSTPNTMSADLDLNSNDIINAASIESDTLTIGGSYLDLTTLSGLGSIAGQFLNPTDVEPTTRDGGSALQTGDIYYNTAEETPYMYTGTEWLALISTESSVTLDNFSGDNSTASFTLSVAPLTESFTFVYISGVYQQKNAYSISGTTLTFSSAPPSGSNNIEVVTYSGKLLSSANNFSDITITGGTITGATVTVPHLTSTVDSGESLKLLATSAGTPINTLGWYDTDGGLNGLIGYSDASSHTLQLINNKNAFLRLGTNSTNRLSIDGSGNVGINKTTPSYTLDVTGDINFTGTLRQNGSALNLAGTGTVLEELHSLCNTTSLKARANMEIVTTHQDLSTTYADVVGSKISGYTCPTDTSEIIYEFNYQAAGQSTSPMSHWKLYYSTDGASWTEVTKATTGQQPGSYGSFKYPLRWVFKVNAGSDDSTVGQFSAARPTLYFKWQARSYSTGAYATRLHGTYYWEGTTGNQFSLPSVCIKAIA